MAMGSEPAGGGNWPTTWPLLGLLAVGLSLRLLLMPQPEPYPADASTYWQPWLAYGIGHGLTGLYEGGEPAVNYPPLYLALLVGLGKLFRPDTSGQPIFPFTAFLIKLPAVLADLAVAVLLYRAAAELLSREEGKSGELGGTQGKLAGVDGESSRGPESISSPLAVAALWLLNPAVIYVSAYWGQVDSIHTLWMLAALLAALAGQWLLAGGLLALGLLTKLQAIVILPLLLYLAWRRGSTARRAARALLRVGLGMAAVLALGLLPFALSGDSFNDVLVVYAGSVGFYPALTLNAYNFWWPIEYVGNELLKLGLTDDMRLLGPVTIRWVGLALLAAYTLLVLRALDGRAATPGRGRDDPEPGAAPLRSRRAATPGRGGSEAAWLAFFAAGMLAFGFFMLPTEIHERYILPALAFLAPVAWRRRHRLSSRLRRNETLLAYLLLSAGVFMNILQTLPFAEWFYNIQQAIPGERILVALLNIALFAWFTWRYWQEGQGQNPWIGDIT